MLRLAVGLLVLLAWHSETHVARAQAQDESSDAVARGLFQAGRASYDAGKYEDALKYFQQAYDLSQRAALLYNIGQAADRLHQDRKTLEAFRLYLQLVPEAPNRAEVEGRLRTLERLVELEQSSTTSSTTPTAGDVTQAPPESEAAANATVVPAAAMSATDEGPGIAPWLVIGGGGLVAVTGTVLMFVGAGQISDVENAPRGTMYCDVSGKADSGPTLVAVGGVLLGLGVVGAAAGTVWLLGSRSEEHVEVVLTPLGLIAGGAL